MVVRWLLPLLLLSPLAIADGGESVHVQVVAPVEAPNRYESVEQAFARSGSAFHFDRLVTLDTKEILRARGNQTAKVAVWIDVTREILAKVYLHARASDRFLFREVELAAGLDEIGRETLAQVIESSVAALLESEPVGLTRAQATVLLAPIPARPWFGEAGMGYAASTFSSAIPVRHGPTLALSLVRRSGDWRLSGSLAGVLFLPQAETSTVVGLRIWSVESSFGGTAERDLSSHWRLGLSLGGGYDVVHAEPRPGTDVKVSLQPGQWKWISVVQSRLVATYQPTVGPAWYGALTVRMDPVPRHYDLAGTNGTLVVVKPFTVQPGLEVGARWP